MRKIFICFLFCFLGSISLCDAQIVINGPEPPKLFNITRGKLSFGISYGSILWKDSKEKDLPGYTDGLELFNTPFFRDNNFSKFNKSSSFRINMETLITKKVSVRGYLGYGKLKTGINLKPNLFAIDNSKIFQLATYLSVPLNANFRKKFKIQYMLGPEFMYVNKNAIIKDYIEVVGNPPQDYNQRENIFEVGLTTGIGLNYDISKRIGLFSDILGGISFPGTGIKANVTSGGLKYYLK